MEYYFDEIDPTKFQRLINTILVARFGEDARLTPLRGKDGGRDGETAPGNPYLEFKVSKKTPIKYKFPQIPRKGRYLFQVKHHRMIDRASSETRKAVVNDFKKELKDKALKYKREKKVNYFFLITNVTSSRDAIEKIDEIRKNYLNRVDDFHADVWWKEAVVAYLDQMPSVWSSFPEIFAGGKTPLFARIVNQESKGSLRAIRMAINHQYDQDKIVKFRQIELEKKLSKLFVDLCVDIRSQSTDIIWEWRDAYFHRNEQLIEFKDDNLLEINSRRHFLLRKARYGKNINSALNIILDESRGTSLRKLILEGGPGQGKSTLTQMAVQIYRQQILNKNDIDPEKRWIPPKKLRLPFRIELRKLAEWLNKNEGNSIEAYLASLVKNDSGGNAITVNDIQTAVEGSPVLLVFDGLDEIGSDNLRDKVLKSITECINRFENELQVDLRVIVTTRPPALSGRRGTLVDFVTLSLVPMEKSCIKEYINRWLSVQSLEGKEKERIRESFERRQNEPHVEALARNPMQLSVLLQLIRLKGEAFPDRRAELYRDYFQIVIDRDVEKSPDLSKHRTIIQTLHGFIGYKIHTLTEVNQADRTLERKRLLEMSKKWLEANGNESEMVQQFFKLGEERFGLIVASKGEGEETKYGYAVQPIQEYFAADFICNQIVPGDAAHDLFQKMIHRPYWKEVALFLAGLRRPNEKVDLIARAKEIDQNNKLGWYQDGKSIILQLLQEGVFSEPKYVFSQALEFLFESLDTKRLEVQREPSKFIKSLGNLLNPSMSALEQHRKCIKGLLQDYKTCEDKYTMKRLYYVAHKLLYPNDFLKTIMLYEGNGQELVASIRFGWPYRWKVDFGPLLKESSFWDNVPEYIWARTWWLESFGRREVLDIPVPDSFHKYLVELFATNISNKSFSDQFINPFIKVYSKLAVWKMVQYQQMIQLIQIGKPIKKEIDKISIDNSEITYVGLDKPFQIFIRDVIQLSRNFLIAFYSEDQRIKNSALREYIDKIKEYLKYDGLLSWVACKCAVGLIKGIAKNEFETIRFYRKESILNGENREDIKSLISDISPFYDDMLNNVLFNPNRGVLGFRRAKYFMYPNYQVEEIPKSVRLKFGEKPVELVEILANNITHGQNLPFEWIKTMQFSNTLIRPLFKKCKGNVLSLLKFLGQHRFVNKSTKPLLIQDTQKILKIARNTNDHEILAGVTVALANASFLRIAEAKLILKLLQTNSDPDSSFSCTLFKLSNELFESRDLDSHSKEIELIEKIVKEVFDKPKNYPFKTVCQAANFFAEHKRSDLTPLLDEEKKLGIKFSSK